MSVLPDGRLSHRCALLVHVLFKICKYEILKNWDVTKITVNSTKNLWARRTGVYQSMMKVNLRRCKVCPGYDT